MSALPTSVLMSVGLLEFLDFFLCLVFVLVLEYEMLEIQYASTMKTLNMAQGNKRVVVRFHIDEIGRKSNSAEHVYNMVWKFLNEPNLDFNNCIM